MLGAAPASPAPLDGQGLVVAFDLDMTLIDTVPGVSSTLVALAEELGLELPVDEVTSRLGPPLDVLLQGHVPADAMTRVVDRFRELYVEHAIHSVAALDGAVESIAAVRHHGGRVVVVTGKYEPNARRHVEHLALDVDHVSGLVVGAGKADVLRREGASILVGDHVHDVEGARAAGITSVSVLTGGCAEEELVEAGTDVVLADLTVFPAWLDAHLTTAGYPMAPLEV
jgi:phosphoglycolate phosphatase-like HAD superfamily hydrolase